ncbi:hypothetical protein [Pajaroellobacter abortibovis]|nr:hypothetical protein [Pajaroellobacter abortibovis]
MNKQQQCVYVLSTALLVGCGQGTEGQEVAFGTAAFAITQSEPA